MRNTWLPLGVILTIIILFTVMMRDFIDEALVAPLLYVFWIGRLLFVSIPQSIIWGLFLLAAAFITGKSLFKKRASSARSYPLSPKQPGRIEHWLKLIRQAEQEPYYKWQLAQRLRRLTLDALAHDERLTRKQVRRRLVANQLDLPPAIQAYLQASTTSFIYFLKPARPFFRWRSQASPLDLDPEQVARFLEEKFNL